MMVLITKSRAEMDYLYGYYGKAGSGTVAQVGIIDTAEDGTWIRLKFEQDEAGTWIPLDSFKYLKERS